MNFRTIVPLKESDFKISYNNRILSIGSCFSTNIAKKLKYYNFQIVTNPFGILFHPLAIEKLVKKSLENTYFDENDFFKHNDLWHSFDLHSELSQTSLSEAIDIANKKTEEFKNSIQNSDFLFITLGTSWVYSLENGNVVANCHKVPQADFSKKLLSVSEIEKSIQNTVNQIKNKNPKIKIVYTISPVRHLKDGFVENQISKAHLIAGLHSFLLQNTEVQYFPSYEIMLDELRDYRFYAEDMLHPSDVAIDYIWERFVEKYISEECFYDMKQIDSIQKGLKHKVFYPKSEQSKIFQQKLSEKIHKIIEKYPFMTFQQ
ncbi:GSCFA domain-containing protein [Capnocytophaga cynodegmi]|uniref:GSCFA domain-containing protein n=1 Tax=Capnocytophaga cynodegmi TaxID=28189 RepID=UPI00385F9044